VTIWRFEVLVVVAVGVCVCDANLNINWVKGGHMLNGELMKRLYVRGIRLGYSRMLKRGGP